MKRVVLAIAGTVSGLVMLLGFKTHAASGTGGTAAPAPSPSASASTSAGASSSATPASGSAKTRTVTGDSIDTRWGPVQVQVTLTGSKITKVQAIRLPDGNPRDLEINDFAVPQLTQETLSAQNSQIDMVSGATYTSQGYIQSLQSALDKAGK